MSRQSQSQRDGDSNRGSGQECFFCKESGHRKPDCPKFKLWLEKKGGGGGGGGGGAGQRGRPMRGGPVREEKPTQMEEEGSFYDKEGTKPGDEDWGGPAEAEQERKEEKNTLNEVFKPAEDKSNFVATDEKSKVVRDPRLKGLLERKPKKPKPEMDHWMKAAEKQSEGNDAADDGWGVREKDSPEKTDPPEKVAKAKGKDAEDDAWGVREKESPQKAVKATDNGDPRSARKKDSSAKKDKVSTKDDDNDDDAWGVRAKDPAEKRIQAADKDDDDAWGVRRKDSSEKKVKATEKDSDDAWGVREKEPLKNKKDKAADDDAWGVRKKDSSERVVKPKDTGDAWGVREKDSSERVVKPKGNGDAWGVREKDSSERAAKPKDNGDAWGVRKKDMPEIKGKATGNGDGWGVRKKSVDQDESTPDDEFASELERQINKKLTGKTGKSPSPPKKSRSSLGRSRSPPKNSFRQQSRSPPRRNRSPEQMEYQRKSSESREREQRERQYWEGNKRKDRYLLTRGRFTKEREERDWGLTTDKPYKEPAKFNSSPSSDKIRMMDPPMERGQAYGERFQYDTSNDRQSNRQNMPREEVYQNSWQTNEERRTIPESNNPLRSYGHVPDGQYQPPLPRNPLRQGPKLLSQQDDTMGSDWKKRESNTDWAMPQETFSQVQRFQPPQPPLPVMVTQFKDNPFMISKQPPQQKQQQWGNNDYSENLHSGNIPNGGNYNFNRNNPNNPAGLSGDRLREDLTKPNNSYQFQNDFGRFGNAAAEVNRNNGNNNNSNSNNNPFASRNMLAGSAGDQGRKNVNPQRGMWAEPEKIDETKHLPYVQAIKMNTVPPPPPPAQRPLRQPRQQGATIIIDDEEADLRKYDSYRQNSSKQFETAAASRQPLRGNYNEQRRDALRQNYDDGNISPVYEPNLGSNRKKRVSNNMLVNPDDDHVWTMASPTYVPERDDEPNNYAHHHEEQYGGYNREHVSLEQIYDFDKEEDEYNKVDYQSSKFKSCIVFLSESQLQRVDPMYLRDQDFFEKNLLQCLYPHRENKDNCFLAYEGHLKMKKQILNISEVIDAKVMAYSNHSWSQLQILPSLKQTIQPRSTKEFKPLDFETVAKTLKQMIKRDHYDRIFYLLWLEGATKEDNLKLDSFSKYLYDNRLVSGVNMENFCFTMAHIGQIFPGVQSFKRPNSLNPVKLVLIVNLEVYFQIGYRPVPF